MRQQLPLWLIIFGVLLLAACGRGTQEDTETDLIQNRPTVTYTPTAPATGTTTTFTLPTPKPDAPDPSPTAVITDVQTVRLDIKGFYFRPLRLQVPVGATVIWTNHDDIQHTITSGIPKNPTEAFDSDFFYLNESYSHTFTEPGEYPYFCRRHNHMQATIMVIPTPSS